jgi:hypothetical protein
MALYREDATGFLVELSAPASGYTAVAAMPTDTLANRVNWWRSRDVDAALGQSSVWHPSIQSANPEVPKPPGLAGSGINICSYRYSAFEEAALPPLALTSCTASQQSGGYNGVKCLRLTASAANGEGYLNGSSSQYNIKLTPNKKWIISLWARSITTGSRAFTVLIKTSGTGAIYSGLSFTTSSTAGTWTRFSGVLDLTADASSNAVMGLRIAVSGAIIEVDGLMMEEQIGDGTNASAYYAPDSSIDGSQLDDGTCSVAKLAAGTIGAITINMNGSGSIIQSSNFVPGSTGWRIRGDGVAEFQNVTVRGSLNAADLVAGTIAAGRYAVDTIGAGPVIAGTLHAQRGLTVTAGSISYDAAVQTTPTTETVTSNLSLPANPDRTAVFLIAQCVPTAVATANGWLCGAAYRSGVLLTDGRFWVYEANGTGVPLVFFYYDTTMGTGALNYNTGWHHSMKPAFQTQAVKISMTLLEFSK